MLTEPEWFGGSLDDLVEAHATVPTPLLRKDFIVDPYQLRRGATGRCECRAADRGGVSGCRLRSPRLIGAADDLGLDTLVEVHDEAELALALAVGARIVGINNRDLHSLEVDLATSLRLRPRVPPEVIVGGRVGDRDPRGRRARSRTPGSMRSWSARP